MNAIWAPTSGCWRRRTGLGPYRGVSSPCARLGHGRWFAGRSLVSVEQGLFAACRRAQGEVSGQVVELAECGLRPRRSKLPAHWSECDWRRALRQVARKAWNVRIQGPYRHGSGVVNYLSRYIHGGPIKDHRLIKADETQVSFRFVTHHDGKEKTLTLRTEHFISRVLWHVPVKGQHNVGATTGSMSRVHAPSAT